MPGGYGRPPPPRGRVASPRRGGGGGGAGPPPSRSRDESVAFGMASAYDGGGVGSSMSASKADDEMVNLSFHSGERAGIGAGPPPEWDEFAGDAAPSDYDGFADPWEPPAAGAVDMGMYGDFGADLPPLDVDDMAMDGFGDLPELDIPEGPHVPEPVEIPDFDLDPAVAELQKNIQFIVLLHSQLIALHLETKKAFPALKTGESYLRELVGAEYEALLEDKNVYESKIRDLTQEVRTLKASAELVESLQAENEKLKKLVQTQSRKISPKRPPPRSAAAKKKNEEELRELLTKDSREYVLELEKQLHIYRSKVINLVSEGEAANRALFEVDSRLKEAREDLTAARDDMPKFDASSVAVASAEVSRLESSLMEQKKRYMAEIDKLTKMLEESQKAAAASAKPAAASSSSVWTEEDSMRVQIRELQDQLGVQAAQHFQMQEEHDQKLKEQIETADKCRAKYESVKQHIKTLEAHQKEYMRVNDELKKQNDDFRTMIMSMKKKLDYYEAGGGAGGAGAGAGGPPGRAGRAGSMARAGAAGGGGAGRAGAGAGAAGGGGAAGAGGDGKMSQADFLKEQMAAYEAMSKSARRLSGAVGGGAGAKPPPGGRGAGALAAVPPARKPGPARPAAPKPGGGGAGAAGKAAAGGDPLNPVPVQEIWGRKMKTISQKGSKKRVLVEWHFVTSDNMPHTIVLQHTQDSKAKTRRMLWVDGAEKYNNKSSAASFRIEIDKDVVVITIELAGSQYQYRLTINGLSYSESFQLWKSKHKR